MGLLNIVFMSAWTTHIILATGVISTHSISTGTAMPFAFFL